MEDHRKRKRIKEEINQNQDTINALKRPRTNMLKPNASLSSKSSVLIIDIKQKLSSITTILNIMIMISLFFLALAVIQTNCDVICQKDTSFMSPCTCQNGTSGLLIKCRQSNLAILSNSLIKIQDPIEQLEFEDCTIGRLFGPIFSQNQTYNNIHNGTLRELAVRSSALRKIDHFSFSDELIRSIQYLQFDKNLLQQVPTETLNRLSSNLRLVNLSSNHLVSIEANNFGKLTNLTELDLSLNRIQKIAKNAFNHLQSLEYLNLNGNELAKLEKNLFSFGRKLKHLDLSNNKLTALDRQDFNELTALENLLIANNQLTTIPRSIFTRNPKLNLLDLSFNQLDDIDTYLFKSVRFLKDLNLSGNKIRELGKNVFSPTTRIKRIDLSQNQLQALAPETFKNLEWLEKIDLSKNQIVNISNNAFDHSFNVEIDLSHNKLSRIFYWAFHEVANITKLNLSHNLLSDGVSPIAFFETDCAHLDLSYNLIEDISKLPISNLTGIRSLNISHNQITELNKKSFTNQKVPLYELASIDASHNNISQITGNILERLRSIRFLDLSYNSLRRLTSGAFGQSPTLLDMDMSHNNVVEIVSGTMVGLISLKSLDLSHNRLKKMIPIPVALNKINLTHNDISQLNRAAFPSLNSLLELYLDHNKLAQLEETSFGTLLALNTLSLNYNQLTTIPASTLKDLSSLQNLWLEGNQIQRLGRRSFGPTGLPIVFDLNLSHNNISQLNDSAFEGLLQLLKLNLSYNQLQELPSEAFRGLVSLQTLDLSNNRLTRLENKTKSAMDDLLSLEQVNLSYNKLSMVTGKTFIASAYVPQRLKHLDLSNNLLGIIVNNFADGMRRLETLNLRNNIINEIYPNVLSNATRLRQLDLSQNKLRLLRDGAFMGKFVNLTSLSLASNKLAILSPATLAELDSLHALDELDLSSNRLEQFQLDYVRWIKRGTSVDLRQNQLECPCQLLPFISWIDAIQTQSTSDLATFNPPSRSPHPGSKSMSSSQNINRKYQRSARILSNTTCSKPDLLMNGKPITQLLQLANTPSVKELSCDHNLLLEADLYKRLKAPLQYNDGESYQDAEGNQILKISWHLVEPRLDLINFVLIRARFQQPIDLAAIRISQNEISSQKFDLVNMTFNRIQYNERGQVYINSISDGHQVLCLTYETSEPDSELNTMLEVVNDGQSISSTPGKNTTDNDNQQLSKIFDRMIANFSRFNCIELATLLHHHDTDASARLISGASRRPTPGTGYVIIIISICLTQLMFVLRSTRHFE